VFSINATCLELALTVMKFVGSQYAERYTLYLWCQWQRSGSNAETSKTKYITVFFRNALFAG